MLPVNATAVERIVRKRLDKVVQNTLTMPRRVFESTNLPVWIATWKRVQRREKHVFLIDFARRPHPLFAGMGRFAYTNAAKRRAFASRTRDEYKARADSAQTIPVHVANTIGFEIYGRIVSDDSRDAEKLIKYAIDGSITIYRDRKLDELRDNWPNIKAELNKDVVLSTALPDLLSDAYLDRIEKARAAKVAEDEAKRAAEIQRAADILADKPIVAAIEIAREMAREAWALAGTLPRGQMYAAIVTVESLQREIYNLKRQLRVVRINSDSIDNQRTG